LEIGFAVLIFGPGIYHGSRGYGLWINFSLTGAILLILLFIGSSQLTEGISSGKYPEYSKYRKEIPGFIPWKFLPPAKNE